MLRTEQDIFDCNLYIHMEMFSIETQLDRFIVL